MDFESDLRIDESALDVEWLGQPELMHKYSKIQADARKDFEEAKENLTYITAELDRDIRKKPQKFGMDKITEGALTNIIKLQDKYKDAYAELLDAQYEYHIAQGMVAAVEQRKSALESLIKLLGLQYFSGPTMPRDLISSRDSFVKAGSTNSKSNDKVRIRRRNK